MLLTKENLALMLEPTYTPRCPFVGICGQFDDLSATEFRLSRFNEKILELLPWYSGDWLYPIPGYRTTPNKWTGEQLAMRKELIQLWYGWISTIQCLEAGIAPPYNRITKAFPKRWWQTKAAYLRSLKA